MLKPLTKIKVTICNHRQIAHFTSGLVSDLQIWSVKWSCMTLNVLTETEHKTQTLFIAMHILSYTQKMKATMGLAYTIHDA